ncbi:MAG TPA: hypothetical protein DCL77_09020 [Prolixibacteraceae bacterium]|jgi:hypothetical protein|nr:hypothetical protein [Prolixibacteraceae bacterium]
MVKNLFIVNDVTAFAANAAEALAGKLGIVSLTDGTAALVFAATISAGQTVSFTKGGITTGDIKSKELLRSQVSAYNAGTAQKVIVTLAAPVGETEKFIKLIDVTVGTFNVPVKSYFGANAEEVIAKINADGIDDKSAFNGYSATAALEVISVFAPLGRIFRVAASQTSVIVYSVVPILPEGTYAKVKALEDECSVYEGVTNKVGFPVSRPPSDAVLGNTYDMVYTEFLLSNSVKDGSKTMSLDKIKIIFAIKRAGVVTAATLNTEIQKLG